MARHALGLDLGQVSDFSALSYIRDRPQSPQERQAQRDEAERAELPVPPPEGHQDMLGLKRWPLGTAYPVVVADVADYAARVRKSDPTGELTLAIDGTGVGRGIVDLFALSPVLARLNIVMAAITITGGAGATFGQRDDGIYDWHVPKKELIGAIQMMLQTRRLHIAHGLGEAENMVKELRTFKMKITASANMQMEAWREGQHDDLVLAGAMASWALLAAPLGMPFQGAVGGQRAALPLRQGDRV